MKFSKWILTLAAMLSVVTATAQVNDVFNTVRLLPIGSTSISTVNPQTNGPVDILGFYGRGDVIITTSTNGVGGTLAASVYTSPDSTNWTVLANTALIATTTSVIVTNLLYGTNTGSGIAVTDKYLLPYTNTLGSASSGFVTPYPLPVQFTTTATNINVSSTGTYVVGVNLTDNQRYLQVVWFGTSLTNAGNTVVSAILAGSRVIAP
jgi:hypothetical protein